MGVLNENIGDSGSNKCKLLGKDKERDRKQDFLVKL